jgi:hypothetical protein
MSDTTSTTGQRRAQVTRKSHTHTPVELDLRTPSGRVLPW